MRAIRKLLTGILLAAVLAALALAALEGGLRFAGRLAGGTWPATREMRFRAELSRALALYRRHPYLNTAPREGARVEAFGKRVTLSSLGYRSPERPRAKPPGVVRVLCAGGSTTFDLLAADDAATWPVRLERELRARGLAAEVWNAGFPGWTSLENLISFEIRDGDLAPDLVVLFQGINDLQPAAHRPFDPTYERGHAELAVRALGFELGPPSWLDRSLLVERLRGLAGKRDDPWSRLGPPSRGARARHIDAAAPAAFERNVRALAAAVAARGGVGAKLVVVTQAVRLRRQHLAADRAYLGQWVPGLEPDAAPGELERFNRVLRSLGVEGTVNLIDAAELAGWRDEDFADPLHFSAEGSAKLAQFLAARLSVPLPTARDRSLPRPARSAGGAPPGTGAGLVRLWRVGPAPALRFAPDRRQPLTGVALRSLHSSPEELPRPTAPPAPRSGPASLELPPGDVPRLSSRVALRIFGDRPEWAWSAVGHREKVNPIQELRCSSHAGGWVAVPPPWEGGGWSRGEARRGAVRL